MGYLLSLPVGKLVGDPTTAVFVRLFLKLIHGYSGWLNQANIII